MPAHKLSADEIRRTLEVVSRYPNNLDEAARELGITQSTITHRVSMALERGITLNAPKPKGSKGGLKSKKERLPRAGQVKRYILTCAQDMTHLHEEAWANLLGLAEYYDAKLIVSTLKYAKNALGQGARAKNNDREAEADDYPEEIREYIDNNRRDLTDRLTFCGELNIIPTAARPLSGMEGYTFRKSTIIPHPKVAVQSVASMKGEGVKLLYTTGTVTMKNYIKRKEGFRAEHFHTYGGLLVEIDAKGSWWCRHLIHGPDGRMYDLDVYAEGGDIYDTERVAAITWGDIHASILEPWVADVQWGTKGSMLEVLRPMEQHVHDIIDFSARSHHTRKDPHAVYESYRTGNWELTRELKLTATVLFAHIARPWCQTYVVNSNHDRHLERWLKEMDWRDDPVNARNILALNERILRSIDEGDKKFNVLEFALRHNYPGHPVPTTTIKFLAEDESHILLSDHEGGIECGLHGDRGVNGAKGTVAGIAKTDRKTNMMDKHSVAWIDNTICGGTSGNLRPGFNHGLSSWTHADIITYPNATRTIVSPYNGKWRA